MSNTVPKLGLALSGAAARSAFYVGFVEVLQEHDVPIEVITAQSGASIVAASYACKTLHVLKRDLLSVNRSKIMQLLTPSLGRGGLYSFDPAEDFIRQQYTKGLRFEDVSPKLCFAATNLESGELVPLAMGDIAHAIRVTCSVPGLFTPVRWGNQHLVDGGVISFIPADLARQSGATVVVGVSVRATKHIFLPSQIKFTRMVTKVRNRFSSTSLGRYVQRTRTTTLFGGVREESGDAIAVEESDMPRKNMLRVIGRSLELAAGASLETAKLDKDYGCDFYIAEGVGNFGDSVSLTKMEKLYKHGRETALQNLPHIQSLLRSQ